MELRRFQDRPAATHDAHSATQEADLLRTVFLWKAVGESLDAGQYWLGDTYPSMLPKPPRGAHFQALTVVKGGAQATAVFVIESGGVASQFGAVMEHRENRRLFWLHEAARLFNSSPDAERRQLYERFKAETAKGGYQAVSADLRLLFPFENEVNEERFLMYVPRGR